MQTFTKITEGRNKDAVKQIALIAVSIAFIIVTIFTIFGNYFFHLFSLSIGPLKIIGGILLIITGFQTIGGLVPRAHRPIRVKRQESKDSRLAFSPVGTPLIAGPGTIILAMVFACSGHGVMHILEILVGFALNCLVCYFIFTFSGKITKNIGHDAVNAISRFLGIIVCILGLQMLISGLELEINQFII